MDFQKIFSQSILGDAETNAIENCENINLEQAQTIYRRNHYIARTELLEQHFPKLARYLGEERFLELIKECVLENDCEHWDINRYPNTLSKHLAKLDLQDFPAAFDLCRLEKAWMNAKMAPDDSDPLTEAILSKAIESDPELVCFAPASSSFFLQSNFDLLTFFKSQQDLKIARSSPQHYHIFRSQDDSIQISLVTELQFELLIAMQGRTSMQKLVEQFFPNNPELLIHEVQQLISNQSISQCAIL